MKMMKMTTGEIPECVKAKINPSALRPKDRGFALGLRLRRAQSSRSGRRLRVDPERAFISVLKKQGLGAVEGSKIHQGR